MFHASIPLRSPPKHREAGELLRERQDGAHERAEKLLRGGGARPRRVGRAVQDQAHRRVPKVRDAQREVQGELKKREH